MAWIITKDILGDEPNAVGVTGPRNASKAALADLAAGGGHAFRLLDGDGEAYYLGRSSSSDDDAAFEPLEDFGEPNAGCTDIQYRGRGGWTSL
jgi:hypothetical protein|tara:strand:+ start:390 stop:668 length:279 start_codon:yes stop_codon:yes gene_type:complete